MLCCAVARAAARHFELLIPSWVDFRSAARSSDLDGDGSPEELSLSQGSAHITSASGETLYTSEHTWHVQDALVGDVTGDGRPELVMLVWRRGNYGNSRPFWERGIDLRMTQHLYVMGLENGSMHAVWMSHELGHALEVTDMQAHDGDQLTLTTRQGNVSTWQWDFFGFTLVE